MEMAIDTPSPSPSTSPAPSAAAGRQMRTTESVRLEHQLVRLPLETLKSTARANHRLVEKEIAAVLSSAAAAAVDHLTSRVSRLHGLKRKMEMGARAEELQVQRCRARLDRLAAASAGDDGEWEDMRLKRILVDCMLRMSYYDTATKLAETSGIKSKLEFLLRLQEFVELVKAKNFMQSIVYARKFLAPWGATHMKELQRATATLVFRSSTNCFC